MKSPYFLAPFLDGNSPTRLFQGFAVGVIGTIAIGFIWGGWHLTSTVDEMVDTASNSATVAALAPICANKFQTAALANNGLIIEFRAVDSWQRDDHLKKAGWATFPGAKEPNDNVAIACANLLIETLNKAS